VNEKAQAVLNEDGKALLRALILLYEQLTDWTEPAAQELAKQYAEKQGIKLGAIAQPLRAALSGSTVSPGVFDIMAVLGKDETLARLKEASLAPTAP
jgi:glutamyl-tRNA synthetase